MGCLRGMAPAATLRVANPAEVRPDLLLVEGDARGAWVQVEVQQAIDRDKPRRWQAATALRFGARGTMGDLVVITQEAHVAAWARSVTQATGPSGTHLALHPRGHDRARRDAPVHERGVRHRDPSSRRQEHHLELARRDRDAHGVHPVLERLRGHLRGRECAEEHRGGARERRGGAHHDA